MTTPTANDLKDDQRERELDAALARSQADVAAGRYVIESAEEHMARLDAMLAADSDSLKAVMSCRDAGTGEAVAQPLADRMEDAEHGRRQA